MYSSHATDVVTVLLQGYSLSKVILMVLMAEGVSSSLYTQTHTSEEGPQTYKLIHVHKDYFYLVGLRLLENILRKMLLICVYILTHARMHTRTHTHTHTHTHHPSPSVKSKNFRLQAMHVSDIPLPRMRIWEACNLEPLYMKQTVKHVFTLILQAA